MKVGFDAAPGDFEEAGQFIPGGSEARSVAIWAYPCQGSPEFKTSYTESAVVISGREANPHSKWCSPAVHLVTLPLDEPVGSRAIVDGSSGEIVWDPQNT